ncbi:hypothetical protein F2Q68_00020848 [Brassica cretica]|uniref:Uncharacterized protein n=1 Tax=Brassica cretica TaxID=69181 RepID=A0A8S9G5G1_BRACR|nr:hypothetical protein F2Q68_00020848 [Brassica cretica]
MRAVGEIPSSNKLRLQNLVESQLEITKTESCQNALSARFALSPVPFASHLGLLIYLLLVCKLAGFLKTLEYWPRDKFWDLVSGCLILCLEMLETMPRDVRDQCAGFRAKPRRLRCLAMLKTDFFFRMPRFVLEMFAGLKMFRDIARV